MKSQSTGILNLRALAVVSALALPSLALAQTPAPPSPRTPAPTTDTTKPGDAIKPSTDKSAGAAAKLSDADVKIVAHLHHVNQMEIEVGKLAQNNGTMSVKNYGATLIADHQSADQDLTAFAKAHKLATIPADKPQTEADKQDAKDMQTKMAKLKTLKAAEFDREFTTMMTMGHDKELANIDAAIGSVGDPDLKTLLTGVKPVLQRHADQARDLQKNPPQAALTPSPASEQPR
jgi:putative membrane protein